MSSFCICKSYSHFFSKKACELDIVLIRTVKIFTSNELIKLKMLCTTGSRAGIHPIYFPSAVSKNNDIFWQHLKHFDYKVGIIRNELLLLWIWLMCKFQQIAIKSTKIKCFPIIISKVILPLSLIKEGQLSVTGKSVCTKYWSGAYRT